MANWFDKLCSNRGLVALPAVKAKDIEVGNYLFTVTGDPRKVARVTTMVSGAIRVSYENDTWYDIFHRNEIVSFYARKAD